MLTRRQATLKRAFDVFGAAAGLSATWWIIVPAWVAAALDTGESGFFIQERVGRDGKTFRIVKLRTMRPSTSTTTTVTTGRDPRITPLGAFLRRSKIDELPQLLNILAGDMSFVGPRPDMPGFADALEGDDRVILAVRPGITGPATLKFRREEDLLAQQDDPETYNRDVIYPEKVRLNKAYVQDYRFRDDLRYILKTILPE